MINNQEEAVGQREEVLCALVRELESINENLARLKLEKEEVEASIIAAIGHDYEGSKTYEVRDRSITIKTESIYALDKKAYISGDYYLPPEFDPVLQKVSYEVNKKLYNSFYASSPFSVRQILDTLIEKKAAKPNVSLKVRI